MQFFRNEKGYTIVLGMVKAIQENKDLLGEIDGLIGDGDHGMNMNKGFTLYEKRYGNQTMSFSQCLLSLGGILLEEIGGSMGPIYGTVFMEMGEAAEDKDVIGLGEFAEICQQGYIGLKDIIEAEPGDKTLIDTLYPAVQALKEAVRQEKTLEEGLKSMQEKAEQGKESTRDLQARYGRSSRLGKRSCGVLDAGAVSCNVLLQAMAEGILQILEE
ncbi:MAG: dihydroxyacetone kinase subunit DhaL [Blautia sp.]|jgi:dihydroxyacetone kinase-like protein